jgi:hypothetical protein
MNNIYLSLGCSLTSIPGWVDHFNEDLQMKVYPLSEGASSNITQVHKLKNWIVKDNLFDKLDRVVLLWQITAPSRFGTIVDNNEYNQKYKKFINHIEFFDHETAIFGDNCIGLLSNSEFLKKTEFSVDAYFEQFIIDILIFSRLVKKIVIWYGWKDMYDHDRLEKINNIFKDNKKIHLIDMEDSIVDWCRNRKLSFFDEGHPSKESSIEWGKNILLPVVKKII